MVPERGKKRVKWITGLAAGLLVVAYTLGAGETGATPPAPAPTPAGSAAAAADDVAAGPAAPVDPVAPAAAVPVTRNGKRAARTVAAPNRGAFAPTAPVTFPDGVSLSVDKVARAVQQGRGPGEFHGRPYTVLTLTLTNGTAAPIDLSQVVVTTTYGTPPLVASPIYEDGSSADFAGTVAPGARATATYAFAIPPAQARSAVTTVDFDDVHAAATFTGLS